jgi:hypothetical protein
VNKHYSQLIANLVENIEMGVPFFTQEITDKLISEFDIDEKHAKDLVNSNLKRLKSNGKIEGYKKGIYYKTKKTAFGNLPLNSTKLVNKLFMNKDDEVIGYETGASFFHHIGLTTLFPKFKYIATNKAINRGTQVIKDLKVVIRKPNTQVTKENYLYLQVIDVIENKDKVLIDSLNPYAIINNFIETNHLDYGKLVGMAHKNYSKEVIGRIGLLAEETRL